MNNNNNGSSGGNNRIRVGVAMLIFDVLPLSTGKLTRWVHATHRLFVASPSCGLALTLPLSLSSTLARLSSDVQHACSVLYEFGASCGISSKCRTWTSTNAYMWTIEDTCLLAGKCHCCRWCVRAPAQSRKIHANAIIKFILRIIKYISHSPLFCSVSVQRVDG